MRSWLDAFHSPFHNIYDAAGWDIGDPLDSSARPAYVQALRHAVRAQAEPDQGFARRCVSHGSRSLIVQVAAIGQMHVHDCAESLTVRAPAAQPDRQPVRIAAGDVAE